MSRFTKALRQKIVTDFASRHGGHYDPSAFVEEVRRTGASHLAHSWFEWDASKAAHSYQVNQARDFARDLKVSFKVEVVNGGRRSIQVRETAMPLVLSPLEGRKSGGGYLLVDPDDPAFMHEHVQQAALALRSWLSRYSAALEHVHQSRDTLDAIVTLLESQRPNRAAA